MRRYHCSYCGRIYHGVTNRRAKRPLDDEAAAAASAHVSETCPRIDQPDGTERAVNMTSEDYLCRRTWMDKYLEEIEKDEDKEDKIEPKKKEDPIDPVFDCPAVGALHPDMDCAIVWIMARCEHSGATLRAASDGETLGVVPGASFGSDKITLEASMQRACGEHPVWTVTGQSDHNGPTHSFDAYPPILSKLWLIQASPRKYAVSCAAHHCPRALEVHAYPSDELSITVDLKKLLEVIRKVTDAAEMVLDTVADKFEWKFLEGKISAQAGWKEHTDHRAYYAYAISMKLEPIFGAEFKVTVGPSKITKWAGKIPLAGKYVEAAIEWLIEAGVYLKLNGGINIDISYKRDTPDQEKFVDGIGPGLGGTIGAAVGAEAGVVGELVKVELEVGGAIKGTGAPFIDDKGFGIDKFQVDFDGLKGSIKLVFGFGILDINENVALVDASTLYGPEKFYLYEE